MKIEKAYLSMAGGGMLVLSHVGMLWALRERGVEILGAAGTSAGALGAACSASDLTPGEDLNDLILSFFPVNEKLMQFRPHEFFSRYGILALHKLEKELRKHLPKTFADCKHPVAVFTSNTDQQVLSEWSTFKTPDQDLVARTVDSCRIPGIFQARKIGDNYHTDGGLVYNYPLDYWKKNNKEGDVIGVRFDSTVSGPLPERKPWYRFVHNTTRHFMGHASMVFDALAIEQVEDAPDAHQILLTVPDTLRAIGVSGLTFDMTRASAEQLIRAGREQTHLQLDNLEKLG